MQQTLLTDKVAVVTGAASGMGRATAQAFAREGARVVVADLDVEGALETAGSIGERAIALQVDVADPSDCRRIMDQTVAQFGRLDVLFNNAAVAGATAYVMNQEIDDWRRVIDVNLGGVFYCSKYAIGHMLECGGGVIINNSSIDGQTGMATLGPYTAAKHGVIGLTRTIALEYGRQNIRCVAVCPGFIDTPMTRQGLSEDAAAALAQAIPAPGGRRGAPEEVANLVLWLASDQAAYINGSSHVIDAGLTAGFSLPE